MTRLIDRYCRLLDALIALFLAIMVVLVFGNVVLRYGFNSGITVSEEVSRWLFVWLTFLGADRRAAASTATWAPTCWSSRLPAVGKKVCLVVGQLLMLYIVLAAVPGQPGADHDQLGRRGAGRPARRWPSSTRRASSSRVLGRAASCCAISGACSPASSRDDELVMVKESEEQASSRSCRPSWRAQDAEPTAATTAGARHDHRHLPRLAARRDGARHADRLRAAGHAASR